MQLIQGRIKGIGTDSRGIFHMRFGGVFVTYMLWSVDSDIIAVLTHHHQMHGESMEMAASPIIVRFDEVTEEITEVIKVE